MKCIEVVAGIIRDPEGRILIARRAAHKDNSGCWEFPGGKVEALETATEALKRELQEELNIDTGSFSYYNTAIHSSDQQEITLHFFEGKLIDGHPQGSDHDQVAWVFVDQLNTYHYAPADHKMVRQLINEFVMRQ
jgi:8-oxo-dGTP diphosphatase